MNIWQAHVVIGVRDWKSKCCHRTELVFIPNTNGVNQGQRIEKQDYHYLNQGGRRRKKGGVSKRYKAIFPQLTSWQVSCSTFSPPAFLNAGADTVQRFRGHWNYLTSKTWRCTGLGYSVDSCSLASGKPEVPLLKANLGAILLQLPKLVSTQQLFPEKSSQTCPWAEHCWKWYSVGHALSGPVCKIWLDLWFLGWQKPNILHINLLIKVYTWRTVKLIWFYLEWSLEWFSCIFINIHRARVLLPVSHLPVSIVCPTNLNMTQSDRLP